MVTGIRCNFDGEEPYARLRAPAPPALLGQAPASQRPEAGGQHSEPVDSRQPAAAGEQQRGPSLRQIEALPLDGLAIQPIRGDWPSLEWMDPRDLLVDGEYQRGITQRGLAQCERMIQRFDKRKFKPPVVALTERGFEVIDGQHTCIAAASHPLIDKIPVLVIIAEEQDERASAFVGHNEDRLRVTPMQLHIAAVVAGDEAAIALQAACDEAGVILIKDATASHDWKVGESYAIGTIKELLKRRDRDKAVEVLKVLVNAGAAPVAAPAIKAVELLLTDPNYAGQITPEKLTTTIVRLGPDAHHKAKVFASAQAVPLWQALGITWFQARGKR